MMTVGKEVCIITNGYTDSTVKGHITTTTTITHSLTTIDTLTHTVQRLVRNNSH
jgi:hypothetical protein